MMKMILIIYHKIIKIIAIIINNINKVYNNLISQPNHILCPHNQNKILYNQINNFL